MSFRKECNEASKKLAFRLSRSKNVCSFEKRDTDWSRRCWSVELQVCFQAQHLDVPTASWGRVQPSFSVMWFSSFSLACCFLPSSLTIFSFNHWYDWRESGNEKNGQRRVGHVSEGGGCKCCCKCQMIAWKTHQVSHVPLLLSFYRCPSTVVPQLMSLYLCPSADIPPLMYLLWCPATDAVLLSA